MKRYIVLFVLGVMSHTAPLFAQNWGLKILNLPNNQDLVYMVQNDRLYVASGSKVFRINPYSCQLEDSIAFTEPVQKIAISEDLNYLYAIVGDRSKIMRYNLISRQQERTIQMGNASFGGPYIAAEMVIMPKHPLTLVVYRDGSPVNIAIFDDAQRRAHTTEGEFFVLNAHSMIFAGSDSTTLFAVPNGSTDDAFYKIKISPTGAYAVQQAYDLAKGFRKKITWGTDGFVYGSNGTKVDVKAQKPRLEGIYRLGNQISSDLIHTIPDPVTNEVFALYQSFGYVQVTTYNKTSFNQTNQAQIPIEVNTFTKVVGWGSNKFAFINGLQIIILQRCIPLSTAIPSIEQGLKKQTCPDSTVVLSVITGAAKYYWSTGDTGRIVKIKQTYRSQTPLFISVAAADALGCATAFSTPIRLDFPEESAPYVSVEDSRTLICKNDSVKLSVSSNPNQKVEWTNGQKGTILYAKQAGSYAARFISANGCPTVWSFPVVLNANTATPPPRPLVTMSPPDTIVCVDESRTLTAPANYPAYQWSDGAMSQTTTFRAFSGGDVRIFSVRVKDAIGCVSAPSIPITLSAVNVPQQPFITVNGNVLASSSQEGNQWFLNGNPIAGATTSFYTRTLAGDYSVQVTLNGCVSIISPPVRF